MSANQNIDVSRVGAAVFDFGGVLIKGGPSEVRAFGARVGLDEKVWRRLRIELFGNDSDWARLERGETSLTDFHESLMRTVIDAGGKIDPSLAETFMGSNDPMAIQERLRPKLIEAVARLHRVMPTALLTNNINEWRKGWQGVMDVDQLFTVTVDSSLVGTRKPESHIYEITAERLGVSHDAIFFVDDIGQNLKAAHSLGWQTHLFGEEDSCLTQIDAILEAG